MFALAILGLSVQAQSLINIDFGVGSRSSKVGFAATGQSTNDYWNLYRHYDPKFVPGAALVPNGVLADLKLADGTPTRASLSVTNAPGVWGNATGDPMYDTYIFAQNGSNITVAVSQLEPGRYHFYLYGHADPDVTGEQNSVFTLRSGTNTFGPLSTPGSAGWKATAPWQERYQYVIFRDVQVVMGKPVLIDVAPGANGVAVLNGLQIISRGTSPPQLLPTVAMAAPSVYTNLIFREIRYDGKVTDHEARFNVDVQVESMTTNEISAPLFDGDVAVMAPELPDGLRVVSAAKRYRLFATKPGAYHFKLDVVAKIKRTEPWNQISFVGPNTAIASVMAQAADAGVEMQLLSGTQLEPEQKATSRLQGFLGGDRTLSMRWQSKTAEIARKSLVTVDTTASAQIMPTVIKFTTQLRYEILQAAAPKLTVALPSAHALTKLQGEQIRDWQIKPNGNRQLLSVEFIRPVEKSYALTLYSEQTVDATSPTTQLIPPQPLDIERETGLFNVSADDMLVETESAAGLRQVNALPGVLAAYRFYGRPFALVARLKRIEPVLKVADRVAARMEETRLLVSHALTLTVEKAGVYSVELSPQTNFVVADIRGEGVEDWKVTDALAPDRKVLRVNFSSRVLGTRKLEVQLEQAHKTFPTNIAIAALRVASATNETAQIGAASALGVRLKTAGELTGLREIPVSALQSRAGFQPAQTAVQRGMDAATGNRLDAAVNAIVQSVAQDEAGRMPALLSDEQLAFSADRGDWRLTLATERLPARVVADIFNLVTIGDGLVGGSATIRYGLINQGVREFKVKLPAHWKNVEFTGANIRRRDKQGDIWTIALQDKAWGGYTLVITYDYQFDPKKAALDLSGAHAVNVERETGSVAITTAASLEVKAKAAADPLRLIDQTDLAETDRALITRPVLLAYRYTGDNFALQADVTRHEELRVLDAVADRTQLTSVLTEEGQMLTQASFMVKNNDRQFQRFKLPSGADLWACYVNNRPVKAERDEAWLMVSLPRGADRDEAFAVDLVYKQTLGAFTSRLLSRSVQLAAPSTDVPNTYAEWQVYVPPTQRLSGFGGNMTVLRGTTYGLRDAWQMFVVYYERILREYGGGIVVVGGLAVLIVALVGSAVRRGGGGVVQVLAVFCILAILASMMLPALGRAKAKAQRITAVNNLKQIALSARIYAGDHGGVFPTSFEDMMTELSTEKILIDPESGQRFIYVGAGKKEDNPNALIAYSPDGRVACFADGSVQQLTSAQFAEALRQDFEAASLTSADEMARLQTAVVRQQQERTIPARTVQVEGGVAAPINPNTGLPVAPANVPAQAAATATVTGNSLVRGGAGSGGVGGGVDGRTFLGVAGVVGGPAAAGQPPGGSVAVATSVTTAPTAAGIRSIRIDIPRSGQAFMFTKVLNVNDEPLSVNVSVMKLKWFQVRRSVLQLATFITGLVFVWRQIRRPQPNSLWITVGLALVIGSVTSLLIALRLLHVALIAALPVLLLLLLIWLARKYWPWKRGQVSSLAAVQSGSSGPSPNAAGASGAVAAIALSVLLSHAAGAFAQNALEQAFIAETPLFAAKNMVSIVSADYTGTVRERVAQFDATIQIATFATNQTITLFGNDVAIQELSTDAKEVKLIRQGNSTALRLPDIGNVTLRLKLIAKLSGDVTKRQLIFGIPPALASKLTVTIDEAEADVEFPTAIAFKRAPDKKETRVEAVLGAGDRVEMFWTPRVKRATEMAASIFAQNTTLVTVGGGAVNMRTIVEYQVAQGELRQAKLRLPGDQRLLRVEGEWIRTWELNGEGREQILTVDLLKGVAPTYRLTVETEKVLDKLPAQVKVEVPHTMDVIRETGLVGLRGAEEIALAIENATDLQRVDPAEFSKASAQKIEDVVSAYHFLKAGFQLIARAEAVQPQVEAEVRTAVRIGFEGVTSESQINYAIKKAGVFGLKVAVPAGYKVDSVSGSSNVLQWVERNDPRVLEVSLKERALGAFTLRIGLSKAYKDLTNTVEIVGAHPQETQKLTGFVSVSAEPGVAVKTAAFDGLTEIPAAALPDGVRAGSGVLAYKFITTAPQLTPEWKLSVSAETVESWVRAEVANVVTLTETLLSGHTQVRYDIQNAPVKEFRLKVPAALKNVEVLGTNIRRRDQTGEVWRVELQNNVRGTYLLTLTWEQTRDAKVNTPIDVPGIEVLGVERETGSIVIRAKAPLQVVEKSPTEQLLKIDARELPEWAGITASASAVGGEMPVLVYRYLRPGYKLTLAANRFEEAAVLQALVDNARLMTVIADDGQMMSEMALGIRNNGLQHLEVELPLGAKVWSAFVSGEPVRPSARGGKLVLPLERSGADGAPVSVAVTYVAAEQFPRGKGTVQLVSPKLDVPLKNARWELYLPPDYDYGKFAGSMTHEAVAAPVVQVYSSLEYFKKEKAAKVARESEVKGFLSKARSQLSSGNTKEANAEFSQALRNRYGLADEATKQELEGLKRDLGKVQGSNLIQAQRGFTADNTLKLAAPGPQDAQATVAVRQGQQAAQMLHYDAEVAEQQWGALQRAQELKAARMQPLRVNLPTRGLRHVFTQVLQTEVQKPMTIQFNAANEKATSWAKRLATSVLGFLVLWGIVAGTMRRTETKSATQPA